MAGGQPLVIMLDDCWLTEAMPALLEHMPTVEQVYIIYDGEEPATRHDKITYYHEDTPEEAVSDALADKKAIYFELQEEYALKAYHVGDAWEFIIGPEPRDILVHYLRMAGAVAADDFFGLGNLGILLPPPDLKRLHAGDAAAPPAVEELPRAPSPGEDMAAPGSGGEIGSPVRRLAMVHMSPEREATSNSEYTA